MDNTFHLPKQQSEQYKNISENSWYKGPVWWQFSLEQQSQSTLGFFNITLCLEGDRFKTLSSEKFTCLLE